MAEQLGVCMFGWPKYVGEREPPRTPSSRSCRAAEAASCEITKKTVSMLSMGRGQASWTGHDEARRGAAASWGPVWLTVLQFLGQPSLIFTSVWYSTSAMRCESGVGVHSALLPCSPAQLSPLRWNSTTPA